VLASEALAELTPPSRVSNPKPVDTFTTITIWRRWSEAPRKSQGQKAHLERLESSKRAPPNTYSDTVSPSEKRGCARSTRWFRWSCLNFWSRQLVTRFLLLYQLSLRNHLLVQDQDQH
jgi:hypothetical protein